MQRPPRLYHDFWGDIHYIFILGGLTLNSWVISSGLACMTQLQSAKHACNKEAFGDSTFCPQALLARHSCNQQSMHATKKLLVVASFVHGPCLQDTAAISKACMQRRRFWWWHRLSMDLVLQTHTAIGTASMKENTWQSFLMHAKHEGVSSLQTRLFSPKGNVALPFI